MICEECGAEAAHAENFYQRVRYWCERHTQWSGHFEFCGEECTRLLRVVGVPNRRCTETIDTCPQVKRQASVLHDRIYRAATVLFEQVDLDVEHEIQCHADTVPGRLRQLHRILQEVWEILAEGTQDVG